MTPQCTHRDDGGAGRGGDGGGGRGRRLAMINTNTHAHTQVGLSPGTWFPEQRISCLLTVQSASRTHDIHPLVFLSDSASSPPAGLLSIYQPLSQPVTPSWPEFKQPDSLFIHFIFCLLFRFSSCLPEPGTPFYNWFSARFKSRSWSRPTSDPM